MVAGACDNLRPMNAQSIHRAARPSATLLVLDSVIEPGNGPQFAKLLDLNMMVMTDGGRERTEPELRSLLGRGGFELERVVRTAGPVCILEARRT